MKKQILLVSALTLSMYSAFAQSRTVTGTIRDSKGEPAIAAEVRTADGKATVQTDENGNFTLEIPDGGTNELIIDYASEQEVRIQPKSDEPIIYQFKGDNTNVNDLGETVIISSYVQTAKRKSPGAIESFGEERIEKFPITDITRAIEGSAPGIQVTNGGGQPGTSANVQIRGRSSISAGQTPLYVVDGAPYQGDITSINPADIERVTTLKDATATSLFGSRGANGVIVIQTKRGKRGQEKPQITFETKMGVVNRAIEDYETIQDPGTYYQMYWDALRNLAMSSGFTAADAAAYATNNMISDGWLGNYNVFNVPPNEVVDVNGNLNPNLGAPKYQDNWGKELQRTGFRQDHILSMSGASQNTDYYMSVGYLKELGYIKNTDYDRITGRVNVNTNVTPWLKTGLNLSVSLSNINGVADEGLAPGYNPFLVQRTYAPIYPVYYRNADNEKEIDPITGGWKFDMGDAENFPETSIATLPILPNRNVLASLTLDKNNNKMFNMVAVPYVEFKFLKDFTFNTNIVANYYSGNDLTFRNPYYGQFAENGGVVSRGNTLTYGYTWNQNVRWNRYFGKHFINAYAGHESYFSNGVGLSASGRGIGNPDLPNLTGAAVVTGASSSESFHRIESYIANAAYDYDNTYFLTASYRLDGTSRLSPDARWGSFWSVGGAWDMSRSPFLKEASDRWLNYLKIKASYGTTGNEAFSSLYMYQRFYSIDYANGVYPGAISAGLGSNDLTWEKQGTFNGGIEFGILKNRIGGEVNYFMKSTKDMFFNLPTAPSTGVGSRPMNLLNMETKGVEIALNLNLVRPKTPNGFNWNMYLTGTKMNNKITKMPDGMDTLISGSRLYKVGHSIDEFWIVESAGVDQENGDELWYYYDDEGNKLTTNNHDIAIANGGRNYRGTSVRNFEGAVTNDFSYKGVGLSFMFTYGIGGKYYDNIYAFLMSSFNNSLNWHVDLQDRWSIENPNSNIPRNEIGHPYIGSVSTRFLVDASFLNFRNINIYYDFPDRIAQKLKLSKIKVFGSVDNVYIWTKRQGMDPQGTIGNVPGWTYPLSRVISGGLRLTL